MCGIFFYLTKTIRGKDKQNLESIANIISHRGPDSTRVRYYGAGEMACFHRLAITDPTPNGMQPFEDDRYVCMVNGEIYNFKELRAELQEVGNANFQTHSDCEVVLPLFKHIVVVDVSTEKHAMKLCELLDGEFAFIIYDQKTGLLFAGVDELRVRPLFIGHDENRLCITSEQKALSPFGFKRISAVHSGSVSVCYSHSDRDKVLRGHKGEARV